MIRMLKSDLDDETLETTRIPLQELRAQLTAGPEQTGAPPNGDGMRSVSVTQAIRVRRSKNRVPSRLLNYTPVRPGVTPWSDAAFPTVVSLMFTGPTAFHWMQAGKTVPALLMLAGVAGATFTLVSLLSRGLDKTAE